MSDFQDVGGAIASVIDKQLASGFMKDAGACPECGATMFVFMNRKENRPLCRPACPACGFKVTAGKVPTNETEAQKFTKTAQKNDALHFLTQSSVVTDSDIFNKTLDNFEVRNDKQRRALEIAQKAVADILSGEPAHCMLNGTTGTGKSHLAMGILYGVLVGSNYSKRVTFIDFREWLSQMKRGFNDHEAFMKYNNMAAEEVKKSDVVVVDDLGSEAGDTGTGYSNKQWNTDVAMSIFAARENKSTIITSNFMGADLRRIYGDRVVSRITHHLDGRVMLFSGMDDYRMQTNK